MSHKNDSRLVKGLLVNLSFISLAISIHGRPQASIAASFRQSAGYVFSLFRRLKFGIFSVCAPPVRYSPPSDRARVIT